MPFFKHPFFFLSLSSYLFLYPSAGTLCSVGTKMNALVARCDCEWAAVALSPSCLFSCRRLDDSDSYHHNKCSWKTRGVTEIAAFPPYPFPILFSWCVDALVCVGLWSDLLFLPVLFFKAEKGDLSSGEAHIGGILLKPCSNKPGLVRSQSGHGRACIKMCLQ